MISDQSFERYKLRSHYLAERNALSSSDRAAMSGQIIKKIVTLPLFTRDHFFIYCSYQSEVETRVLLQRCLAEGKSVSVPLTLPQRSELLAVAITNPATDLSPGYKGIPEPIPPLTELRRVSPQSIDIAIIPGAVFDRSGYRLGYGGGYYDRFLVHKAPQAYRIGLAFSQQLVNRIPALSHDVPLDMLITENEVFVWPRAGNEKNSCL